MCLVARRAPTVIVHVFEAGAVLNLLLLLGPFALLLNSPSLSYRIACQQQAFSSVRHVNAGHALCARQGQLKKDSLVLTSSNAVLSPA